jgi:hypothetical protein
LFSITYRQLAGFYINFYATYVDYNSDRVLQVFMNTPFSCQSSIPTRDNFLEFYFTPKTLFFMLLRKNYYENLPTQNLEDPKELTLIQQTIRKKEVCYGG